ncbi:hypothetical protein OA92_07580 [Marinomonas sp. SBI22]|uniref:nucleotidyltransferase family protein n=1 Tax=unclassified Marinomonas TaxID=196814 RepID=UPI0007AF72CF|nr:MULTISPECIES: nucleotidyltransferase family protein [unclassified Marinomonas]KZM40465.1 hypothetical protein OA91_19780 [Marinomonas sp. SBI8L]KZM43556.1 hypothetical protein OA92_07580 [Marinomonas sp. SBI22]
MKIAYVLLAAGNASRFGSCKQLAEVHDKAMILHSLETLTALAEQTQNQPTQSQPNRIKPFVVLGAYYEQIKPIIMDKAEVIYNPDWSLGLGASIAKASEVIQGLGDYDAVLFTLSDQVKVNLDDLENLIKGYDGQTIRTAYYANKPGVPAIFPASQFTELKGLKGKQGAKPILMAAKDNLSLQVMDNALFDIDYPEDLEQYLSTIKA